MIQEAIGLELEQVKILKGCFDGFADEDALNALKEIIEEIDEDGEIKYTKILIIYLLFRLWIA